MSPTRIENWRALDLTAAQRAAVEARQPHDAMPEDVRAAAVAAIQARRITAAEVAATLRVSASAVTGWCRGKVVKAGERRAPVQAAETPPEVVPADGPLLLRDRTGERRAAVAAAPGKAEDGAEHSAAADVEPEPGDAASDAPEPPAEAMGADLDPEAEVTAEAPGADAFKNTNGNLEPDTADRALGVITEARRALARIHNDSHWQDWIAIGRALVAGRDEAMRKAGTNAPQGPPYRRAYAAWLDAAGLDLSGINPPAKAALYELVDNLPAVERWRATLTATERHESTHPRAVLRRWRAATTPPPPPDPTAPPPAPTGIRAQLAEAIEERDRLKATIEGDALDPLSIVATAPEETVARALVQRWSTREVRKFATALIERAEARDRKREALKAKAKAADGPTRH